MARSPRDARLAAKWLLTRSDPPVFTDGALYCYDRLTGIWCELPRAEFARQLYQSEKFDIDARKAYETYKAVSDMVAQPDYFGDPAARIGFRNGAVIVGDTGPSLQPHHRDNRLRFALPVDFDPDAQAPQFHAALAEWFRGVPDAEARVSVLQEFAGAALTGVAWRYQRALVLHGAGSDGKSTFVNILQSLFAPHVVTHFAIHQLTHEYARAQLAGKLLNACSELPSTELQAVEALKAVTSGDPVTARRPYMLPFMTVPRAAHVYAGNTLPRIADHSHGFWRRVILVEFNRKFSATEADRTLAERIIDTERAGVAAWAIAGALRLLQRGDYTTSEALQGERADWQVASDAVARFVRETCAQTQQATTPSLTLYQIYRQWSAIEGQNPCSHVEFGRRLRALGYDVVRVGTDRHRAYQLTCAWSGVLPL